MGFGDAVADVPTHPLVHRFDSGTPRAACGADPLLHVHQPTL